MHEHIFLEWLKGEKPSSHQVSHQEVVIGVVCSNHAFIATLEM